MSEDNRYWGGDDDIADDMSFFYEKLTGKSSVLWTPMDRSGIHTPTDSLKDRPDEYSTHGFTCDYESWGQRMCDLAVDACMNSRDMVMGWIYGYCAPSSPAGKKVYAFYIEDHDGEYNNAVSVEDKVLYGYWQVSDVYASLDDARERMRNEFVKYRDEIIADGGEITADRFVWKHTTYCGKLVWECVDTWDPRGWRIVEQEVR